MTRYFICLANSFKYGGRCVAGIEIAPAKESDRFKIVREADGNPRWIRPVQQGNEHEEIATGAAENIHLLDILEIETTYACPQYCQGENTYFKSLKIIGSRKPNDKLLNDLCSNSPFVLHNERRYLSLEEYKDNNRSLMFILPKNPTIVKEVKVDEEGISKTKYSARFAYNGNEYCLPITDPDFLGRMDTYSRIPLIGSFPTGTFYFSISLTAEPWNNMHYKLVAGIVDMRLASTDFSSSIEINDVYRLAEEFSHNTNRCLFITGKAGTGKTTFLRRLQEQTAKNMVVVAPTGVAAINAGGMTIHSFFQLPVRTLQPTPESYRQMFAEQRLMQRKRNMLYHLEMLVIDEISMVRADVLDAVDQVLRRYKYRRDLPFGGVQVVMIGDLMQLSPVVHGEEEDILRRYYDGPYFFQSNVMRQLQPVYIEFDHVFRQQNEQFVSLLNEVRENRLTAEGRALLASRYMPGFKDNSYITLTTHNAIADGINERELAQLSGRQYSFKARIQGNFTESTYPTDETLVLKVGARVMFIKNDTEKPRRFYNGKQGTVTSFSDDAITVMCDDGEVELKPMTWENVRYKEDETTGKIESETLGTFTQFPLRLAWAVTIHKSQGLTFDKVIIDAERAFAAGQVYVALSRCRTLEGIVLSSPLQHVSLDNDRQVLNYVHNQPTTEQSAAGLNQAQKEYQLKLFTELYDVKRLLTMIEQLTKHVVKCVSFNTETIPFLDELKRQVLGLMEVSDKFQRQLEKIISMSQYDYLQQRLSASAGYFVPKMQELISRVGSHPCKCKNKADASDFDSMIGDLYLVLSQKAAMMQALSREASTNAYLQAKSKFVATPMQTQSAFEKPIKNNEKKTLVNDTNKGRSVRTQQDSGYAQEDKMLFERLRLLRLRIAEEESVPAFVVFHDKVLHELATHKPTSPSAMKKIYGVGKKKIEKYGERFIMAIATNLKS